MGIQTTLLYAFSKKKNRGRSYSLKRLTDFFDSYYSAEESDDKPTLDRLGASSNIQGSAVIRVLKRVGLKPFHTRKMYLPLQKEAILRGISADLTNKDIAYFLQLPSSSLSHYRHHSNHNSSGNNLDHRKTHSLTYALVSQIYEARDLGFNPNEIKELYDVLDHHLTNALDHREALEQKIILALSILFPEKEITKPYLPSSTTKV